MNAAHAYFSVGVAVILEFVCRNSRWVLVMVRADLDACFILVLGRVGSGPARSTSCSRKSRLGQVGLHAQPRHKAKHGLALPKLGQAMLGQAMRGIAHRGKARFLESQIPGRRIPRKPDSP